MPARRLHLLRHAKSSWDDPGLADRERPLAKRGRKACGRIAAHLRREGIAPAAVLVSPAVRAAETFDRIREGLPDETQSWTEPRLYGSDADELLDLVRELPSALRSAMLIGHNPSIQELATMLAADGDELARMRRKFPTGALATISFRGPWSELQPGGAELERFVRPKALPDPG